MTYGKVTTNREIETCGDAAARQPKALEDPMNPKPWLPLIAFAIVGSHLLATKVTQMRAQVRSARVRAGGPADAMVDALGANKLWSSRGSCMTHVVEDYATIAISALFVAGMVGMLIGV